MKNEYLGKIMIIPEQFAMLQEVKEEASIRESMLLDAIKAANSAITERGGSFDEALIPTGGLEREDRARVLETLRRSQEILSRYVLVDQYCQDSIEIGTRFQMMISDSHGKEIMDAILIHKRVAHEPYDLFVTCDAPLGISVKGHKVGDVVHYKNNVNEVCTIEILKIYANRLGEEIEEQKLR